MGNEGTIQIQGDLALGHYPKEYAELAERIQRTELVPDEIVLKAHWFDLSMLSHFITVLLRNPNKNKEVLLRISNINKYSFFWRSGFFSNTKIEHEDSQYRAYPSIWKHIPFNIEERANFSPLIIESLPINANSEEIGFSNIPIDITKQLLSEIGKTAIYPYIIKSDLIESREYLNVVLWELIQNSVDHSKGKCVVVGCQIIPAFISDDNIISKLVIQHALEEKQSALSLRRGWLKKHRNDSFMIISCVDDGIGIAASICDKEKERNIVNADRILDAFKKSYSSRDNYKYRYDVHGLALIKELVSSYDGYLFAQSNNGYAEILRDIEYKHSIEKWKVIPGTIIQVLLPIEDRARCSVSNSSESLGGLLKASSVDAYYNGNYFLIANEIRKTSFDLPPKQNDWERVIENIVEKVSLYESLLFIDFIGMPRERHFISLLLQCIRNKRYKHPTVIINISDELFSSIKSLRKLENIEIVNKGAAQIFNDEINILDRKLSHTLTRGDKKLILPLILPITKTDINNETIEIIWFGTGGYDEGIREYINEILNKLFYCDDYITENELEGLVARHNIGEISLGKIIKTLDRCNPGLFLKKEEIEISWKLAIRASVLYYDSIASLEKRLFDAIEDKAYIKKASNDVIYYLNWRDGEKAYLLEYYEVWNIVSNLELVKIASLLLLRKAYANNKLCDNMSNISSIISITASAGRLAREIAIILRIQHWEIPSIYDLDKYEWPNNLSNGKVLIISDLIDTGTSIKKLLNIVQERNGVCLGILSFIESIEGVGDRKELDIPIVSIKSVQLGRPTHEQIVYAQANKLVLEIDPHTLEPINTNRIFDKDYEKVNKHLREIIVWGGISYGHYVYAGHHFSFYFDILRIFDNSIAINPILNWIWRKISYWLSNIIRDNQIKEDDHISLIIPHYSPIGIFAERITRLFKNYFNRIMTLHIAKPFQRAGDKIGYKMNNPNEREGEISDYLIFMDDGIASGGTLAAIIDDYIDNKNVLNVNSNYKSYILAIILFDRLGVYPRKHLKKVKSYKKSIIFDYASIFSANTESYFKNNCPICRIANDLKEIASEVLHLKEYIDDVIESLSEYINIVYVDPVPNLLSHSYVGVFDNEETENILIFSNYLLSESVNIEKVKEFFVDSGIGSRVKLEIARIIMIDSYLFRIIHDKEYFKEIVRKMLFDESIDSKYQSWFINNMPYICNYDLAKDILENEIPNILNSKKSIFYKSDNIRVSICKYIDKNPHLFSSIVSALWNIKKRMPINVRNLETKDKNRSYFAWNALFKNTPYEFLFTSALSSDSNDIVRKKADMLLCNFITHFSTDHKESYRQKIIELQRKLDINERKDALPIQLMKYITSSIKSVRIHYNLNQEYFSDNEIDEIDNKFCNWIEGDDLVAKELCELISNKLVPSEVVNEKSSNIGRLLAELTPKANEVINESINSIKEWMIEQINRVWNIDKININDEILKDETSRIINRMNIKMCSESVHAFGNRSFLIYTLTHLIKNVFEYGFDKSESMLEIADNIEVSGEERTAQNKAKISFVVKSKEIFKGDIVESFFNRYGGLMAQRDVIKSWGGSLYGESLGTQGTIFVLQTDAIINNRSIT